MILIFFIFVFIFARYQGYKHVQTWVQWLMIKCTGRPGKSGYGASASSSSSSYTKSNAGFSNIVHQTSAMAMSNSAQAAAPNRNQQPKQSILEMNPLSLHMTPEIISGLGLLSNAGMQQQQQQQQQPSGLANIANSMFNDPYNGSGGGGYSQYPAAMQAPGPSAVHQNYAPAAAFANQMPPQAMNQFMQYTQQTNQPQQGFFNNHHGNHQNQNQNQNQYYQPSY
jgi:hypothetical protein